MRRHPLIYKEHGRYCYALGRRHINEQRYQRIRRVGLRKAEPTLKGKREWQGDCALKNDEQRRLLWRQPVGHDTAEEPAAAERQKKRQSSMRRSCDIAQSSIDIVHNFTPFSASIAMRRSRISSLPGGPIPA